jgi:hypothetical protein
MPSREAAPAFPPGVGWLLNVDAHETRLSGVEEAVGSGAVLEQV